MILEERDYTLYPGKLAAFVKLHGELGLPVQAPILGGFVGHFTSEIGELNHVVHLWRYDSFEERQRRRAELMQVPAFQDYLAQAMPLILKMENRLLIPTAYSPLT